MARESGEGDLDGTRAAMVIVAVGNQTVWVYSTCMCVVQDRVGMGVRVHACGACGCLRARMRLVMWCVYACVNACAQKRRCSGVCAGVGRNEQRGVVGVHLTVIEESRGSTESSAG